VKIHDATKVFYLESINPEKNKVFTKILTAVNININHKCLLSIKSAY